MAMQGRFYFGELLEEEHGCSQSQSLFTVKPDQDCLIHVSQDIDNFFKLMIFFFSYMHSSTCCACEISRTKIIHFFRLLPPNLGLLNWKSPRSMDRALTSRFEIPTTLSPFRNRHSSSSSLATTRRFSPAIVFAKRAPIDGVSDELNLIASRDLDQAPARRRVRSAFVDLQQNLDHCLFKVHFNFFLLTC